jgi:hypothetical protein
MSPIPLAEDCPEYVSILRGRRRSRMSRYCPDRRYRTSRPAPSRRKIPFSTSSSRLRAAVFAAVSATARYLLLVNWDAPLNRARPFACRSLRPCSVITLGEEPVPPEGRSPLIPSLSELRFRQPGPRDSGRSSPWCPFPLFRCSPIKTG